MTTIVVDQACCMCGVRHEIDVPYTEMQFRVRKMRWDGGALIQDAFPELTMEQRELILTGTCQKAWDEMFAEEGGEEDGDGSHVPGAETDEIPF